MIFAERLKEILDDCELTQKELADKLHIHPTNITNWKNGDNLPSVDVLFSLCMLLEVSADYLLGLEDETGKKLYETDV